MTVGRSVGLILLMVVTGLVIGSLLGELIGSVLPPGRVQQFITRGPTIGLTPPATLDLRLLAMTFGLSLKINVVGVVGIIVAALTLRRL